MFTFLAFDYDRRGCRLNDVIHPIRCPDFAKRAQTSLECKYKTHLIYNNNTYSNANVIMIVVTTARNHCFKVSELIVIRKKRISNMPG